MWLTTDELNFFIAAPPVDLNANTTAFPCWTIDMGRYESIVACIMTGAGSTYGIHVQCASTNNGLTGGTTGNFVAHNYRISGSGSTGSTCDLLGTRTAVASTAIAGGTSISSTTSPYVAMYVEVKSQDVPEGYPFVGIVISTAAQAHEAAVLYVCKPRYLQNTMLPGNT